MVQKEGYGNAADAVITTTLLTRSDRIGNRGFFGEIFNNTRGLTG